MSYGHPDCYSLLYKKRLLYPQLIMQTDFIEEMYIMHYKNVHLNINKAFDAVSNYILISKLRKKNLSKTTVKWVHN